MIGVLPAPFGTYRGPSRGVRFGQLQPLVEPQPSQI